MKLSTTAYIAFFVFIGFATNGMAQCEPWCQGMGGYYITYNSVPHLLWWHRHQKQRVYKEQSIGRYFDNDISNSIVAIATPPNVSNKTQYYYGNGTFYIDYSGGYIVVEGPIGYTVPSIPYNSLRLNYKGNTYYYFSGNFFVKNTDDYYQTVKPPIGIILPLMPANSIMTNDGNGNIVYQYGHTYYQPINRKGQLYYQVIGYSA